MRTLLFIIVFISSAVVLATAQKNTIKFESVNFSDTVLTHLKRTTNFLFEIEEGYMSTQLREDSVEAFKLISSTPVWDCNSILLESDSTLIVLSYEIRALYWFWLNSFRVNFKSGVITEIDVRSNCNTCTWLEKQLTAIPDVPAQSVLYRFMDKRQFITSDGEIHVPEYYEYELKGRTLTNRVTGEIKNF